MVAHRADPGDSIDYATRFFGEAPFAVFLIEDSLRIRELNGAAHRLFGTGANALVRDLHQVAPLLAGPDPVETVLSRFRRTLETGEPHRSAGAAVLSDRRSGKTFYWEMHRVPLETGHRGVVCYLHEHAPEREAAPPENRPITPKHEQREASDAKDEFLATVSHELRSPLQGILGWLTLLQIGRLDPSQTARALQSVERSVRLQAQLVNDIMDIARIEARRFEIERVPLDLAKLLRTTAEEFLPQARARGIDLEVDVRSSGLVLGDRERLHQVFANLLSNSLKFTPAGGSISVRCDRQGDDVTAIVVDTGHGIEAEFLPFMFRRFAQADTSITRRHGGLGLGLAIVRHLVELHGGSVTATSPGRDRGTTLIVRLPAANIPDAAQQAEFDVDEIARLDGASILLVDDDEDTLDAMKHALVSLGVRVRAATSVEDGWREVVAEVPDLVVTDLSMPEEDGYELLRRVNTLTRRPPVVALTGLTRREDKERVLAAGFAAFVAKPVDLRQLAASLKLVLEQQAPRM
jgi:signal transduction histidine kinase/ActR/RegA family two-component response regulator